MQTQVLGKTGLSVSRLGVGLSEIRSSSKDNVYKILSSALDAGINFFDTASCYGISEEFLGEAMSHLRDKFVLASKCGHSFDSNLEEWSFNLVNKSVDRSLKLLKTDRIDIMQIHSCELDILKRGEAINALQDAKEEGKILHLGYSGDNDAAVWAAESNIFSTIQTSFNLVEQKARYKLFEVTKRNNLGVIAKRPIANGAWRSSKSPSSYADEYFRRSKILENEGLLSDEPEDRILTSMGFIFSFEEIDSAIIGTQNPDHMLGNIEMFLKSLPISVKTVNDLCQRYDSLGVNWDQRT